MVLCACVKQGFEYKTVYVKYTIIGGAVAQDRYFLEYIVNNTEVSVTRKTPEGKVSFNRKSQITQEQMKRLGESVVEARVFDMLQRYSPATTDPESKPTATLYVAIDSKNKTVIFRPYLEDYLPGNMQKVLFEIRSASPSSEY
jgi:hypothetical protein